MNPSGSFRLLAFTIIAIVVAGLMLPSGGLRTGDSDALVVYCSCDASIAESVIRAFEKQAGIKVDVRFDEEANKSLGLTNLLIAEQQNPRCDVFWNNQTLGTIRLAKQGILQPYHSPNADRIPEQFKDAGEQWCGFSARLRVFLVNTDAVEADEGVVAKLLDSESLQRITIAQPLFGTTLSHYSVLASQIGLEQLKGWHRDIHDRGIQEVRGNSMTRDLVAEGVCDVGYTDTDDAFGAIDAGKTVAILPVRLPDGKTICMPNSVGMIRNCPHPELAKRFIDFVLSQEVEVMLASGAARQIPLGPVDESQLPEELHQLMQWAAEGVDLAAAADINQQVLDWLVLEYQGQ